MSTLPVSKHLVPWGRGLFTTVLLSLGVFTLSPVVLQAQVSPSPSRNPASAQTPPSASSKATVPSKTASKPKPSPKLAEKKGPGYHWWCFGKVQDTVTHPTGGLLLAGGGDGYDDGYRWLVEHARGGDMVVLRASGDATDDEDKRGMGPQTSLQTILVNDRKASSDPFVLERLRHAEAIFFAGGDQSRYIRFFKDTPLAQEVAAAVQRGVPVGGTSAGLAILGQYAFTARYDTVTSPEALRNPWSKRIDLETAFLRMPHMDGVITDTHFKKRDRMGRLLVFMARLLAGGQASVRALAVDEGTAVVMETDGKARVVGLGAVWCLEARKEELDFPPQGPCSLTGVLVQRINPGERFDLAAWKGPHDSYQLDLQGGHIISRKADGSVY